MLYYCAIYIESFLVLRLWNCTYYKILYFYS